jgi:hypothetical protein
MWKLLHAILLTAAILSVGCARTPPATLKFNASSPGQIGPFVFPPSWGQANWYIDPQNASTCASDNNRTCSLATCGTSGDGPCLTYQSVANRWGTYSPRLVQNTTLNFLSSVTTESDPIYLRPYTEDTALVTLTAALPAPVQTGVIVSSVTAKNRATPQLLQLTFSSGTGLAVGQFICNSTHAACAFLFSLASGTTYNVTQPLSSATTPVTFPSEVNTWASADTYSVYNLVQANVVDFRPTQENPPAGSIVGSGAITHLRVWGSATFTQAMYVNSNIYMAESASTRSVIGDAASAGEYTEQFIINFLESSTLFMGQSTNYGGTSAAVLGGGCGAAIVNNVTLGCDIILPASTNGNGLQLGNVYVSGLFNIGYGSTGSVVSTDLCTGAGGPAMWGPGEPSIQGSARLSYPSGAGGAVGYFLNTGTPQLNEQTKGCVMNTASGVGTCNITTSAANLDSNLGATSGCLANLGGASICNSGTNR